MLLNNIYIDGMDGAKQLQIKADTIEAVNRSSHRSSSVTIEFDNAIAFPGIINSHDHLDFNLFPQFGNGTYTNYIDWAADVHDANSDTINAIKKIPKELRTKWGICKNLINGVTTVIEHGKTINTKSDIINIVQNSTSLHSVAFEKKWRMKLNDPFFKKKHFVIHIGEGIDEKAFGEINRYIKNNFFKRSTVAVHGVAMNETQAEHFSALVWCPITNCNLLGKTANIDVLKNKTKILFGTDSTLTADWNLWKQLRVARQTGMVSDNELMDMLTRNAAQVWELKNTGIIAPQMKADIVVANRKGSSLFDINPEDILMVMRNGQVQLFDASIEAQVFTDESTINSFSKMKVNGSPKYIKADVPALISKIKNYYPEIRFPFFDEQ